MLEAPEFPSACPSERQYDFDSDGQRLALHEWGDPRGTPLVLCHGLWDHAHGFDLLAPYLAEHHRVIAIDARGHGDSAWVDNYTWPHMVYDVVHVLQRVAGPRGAFLVGHSYGGGLATHAACTAPELVHKLVNIEGFGPGTNEHPLPGERCAMSPRPIPLSASRRASCGRSTTHVPWPRKQDRSWSVKIAKRDRPGGARYRTFRKCTCTTVMSRTRLRSWPRMRVAPSSAWRREACAAPEAPFGALCCGA